MPVFLPLVVPGKDLRDLYGVALVPGLLILLLSGLHEILLSLLLVSLAQIFEEPVQTLLQRLAENFLALARLEAVVPQIYDHLKLEVWPSLVLIEELFCDSLQSLQSLAIAQESVLLVGLEAGSLGGH